MAIVYDAVIVPSKAELARAWLDRQPWGGSGECELIDSYRFDDPDGQVGVEALIVRRDGRLLHLPLAYRGDPLEGCDLVCTMEHSVLGKRWIYTAISDPVARACYERALRGGQDVAVTEIWDSGGFVERREPTVTMTLEGEAGSDGSLALAGDLGQALAGSARLVASWKGGAGPVASLG